MIIGLLRLFLTIWVFGLVVLALVALSSFIYSTETEPARSDRLRTRVRMALVWPVALLSSAGRARLRRG
jgi:hypothetical protein